MSVALGALNFSRLMAQFMLQGIGPLLRQLSAKIRLLRDFLDMCFVGPDLTSAKLMTDA